MEKSQIAEMLKGLNKSQLAIIEKELLKAEQADLKAKASEAIMPLINKLYYTNNETILCIKGWINYNGEIFESDSDLLKIDLSSEDPIWSLCINDTCNQIVEDQGFKDLVCEGITDYIKNKQVMLSKIKK